MSDSFAPLSFPVVAGSGQVPDWMQPSSPKMRTFEFPSTRQPSEDELGAAEVEDAPPPPDPLAETRAQLEAERAALQTERLAVEKERQALAQARERFEAGAQALVEAREQAFADAEEPVLELAVEIAQAIVQEAIETDAELLGRMAKAALRLLGDLDGVELPASPEAFDALRDCFEGGGPTVGGVVVPLVEDARLSGLGCIVQAGEARVDARIDGRLEAVRDALVHERRRIREEDLP